MDNFNDPFKEFREQQERFRRMFDSPFKRLIEQQRQFAEAFRSPFQDMVEQQERFRRMFENPFKEFQSNLDKLIQPMASLLNEAVNDFEQYKSLMVKMGFPPHHDMDFTEFRDLNEYLEEHGEESTRVKIEEIISKTYTDEMIRIYLEKWKSLEWLTNRYPILQEAIENHCEGRYFSSISTLLPQLEGVIIESTDTTGWINQRTLRNLIDSILNGDGVFSLDDVIKLFYVDVVLDNFSHGDIIKSPLSRHAILHGGDTKFGYRLNSLRCILLFDYFIFKIEEQVSLKQCKEDENGD